MSTMSNSCANGTYADVGGVDPTPCDTTCIDVCEEAKQHECHISGCQQCDYWGVATDWGTSAHNADQRSTHRCSNMQCLFQPPLFKPRDHFHSFKRPLHAILPVNVKVPKPLDDPKQRLGRLDLPRRDCCHWGASVWRSHSRFQGAMGNKVLYVFWGGCSKWRAVGNVL